MGILEDFPADPFTPSLRYAATCQVPIWVPWVHEPIKLGTSLAVSRDGNRKSQFMDHDKTAFSQSSLRRSQLTFTSSSTGNVSSAETFGSSSSSEHIDFTIGAQIDIAGGLVGASGRVKYQQSVVHNDSSVKESFRSTYQNGLVRFLEEPDLSEEAKAVLRTSKEAFQQKYGEYYVAAYVLGGSNASTLSGVAALASSSKDVNGSYTIKIAWGLIKISGSIRSHEQSSSAMGVGSMTGYDTLSNWNIDSKITDVDSYNRLMNSAEENKGRCWELPRRVIAKTGEMGLDADAKAPKLVSWDKCEAICKAGLVVEILLLPYAGLRQYIEV